MLPGVALTLVGRLRNLALLVVVVVGAVRKAVVSPLLTPPMRADTWTPNNVTARAEPQHHRLLPLHLLLPPTLALLAQTRPLSLRPPLLETPTRPKYSSGRGSAASAALPIGLPAPLAGCAAPIGHGWRRGKTTGGAGISYLTGLNGNLTRNGLCPLRQQAARAATLRCRANGACLGFFPLLPMASGGKVTRRSLEHVLRHYLDPWGGLGYAMTDAMMLLTVLDMGMMGAGARWCGGVIVALVGSRTSSSSGSSSVNSNHLQRPHHRADADKEPKADHLVKGLARRLVVPRLRRGLRLRPLRPLMLLLATISPHQRNSTPHLFLGSFLHNATATSTPGLIEPRRKGSLLKRSRRLRRRLRLLVGCCNRLAAPRRTVW